MGTIVAEPLEDHHIFKKPSATARGGSVLTLSHSRVQYSINLQLLNILHKPIIFQCRDVLILGWIVLGFCLTVSYKSVLLATLVSAEYEKPIG